MAKTTVPIELSSTPSIVDNGNATAITIDSSENVGINNASPQTKIHVVKNAVTGFIARTNSTATFENSSGVELYLSSSDSGYGQIRFGDTASTYSGGIQYEHSTDEMLFQCNGSEAMRISGSNVGIGTGSPATKLDVSVTGGMARVGGGSGNNLFQTYTGSVGAGIWAGGVTRFYSTGTMTLSTGATLTTSAPTGYTDAVTITSAGSVGINTGSPTAAKLVISDTGSNKISLDGGTSQNGMRWEAVGGANAFYLFNGTFGTAGFGVYNITTTAIPLWIQNGGNVGINTNSPTTFLYVQGAGGADVCTVRHGSTANSNVGQIIFRDGAGDFCGQITSNGSTNTTAYNSNSDYRLKENVTYDWDATTRLKQLKPARFNFISNADVTFDGFLAHEVSSIVPEATTGEKDEMQTEEYEVTPAVLDDDGNVVTEAVMGTREVPKYQGIDQSKLVPLLVKTIQELEARITALENT